MTQAADVLVSRRRFRPIEALRRFRAAWRERPRVAWSGFLTATGWLSVTLAFAALAVGFELWVYDVGVYLTKNDVIMLSRKRLIALMVSAGGAGAVVSLLAAALFRGDGARGIERAARVASPLVVVWAIQALAVEKLWRAHTLTFLVVLAASVLVLERTLRESFAAGPAFVAHRIGELYERLPARLRRALPFTVVLIAAAGYATYTGYWTIQQHHRLATSSFDLGIADNVIYNAYAGYPFRASVLFGPSGGNFIAGHANFILLLFVPFYAIYPQAETLLVIQSVLLGFAAVPFYGFAKHLVPRWTAVLLSIAYLLYAPLHGQNFYDFHWLPACIFFLFCLFWAIASGRTVLVWVFWLLCVLVREDVPVGLTLVGVFLVVSGHRVLMGVVMTALSALAFVLIKFVIMPAAGTWWFANLYKELMPAGEESYSSVIRTILINPAYFISTLLEKDKLVYALHMFVPLAFVPARRWLYLLCASCGFFFTVMTTDYGPTISISFQYVSHWIPYLFAASALTLAWLGRKEDGVIRRRAALAALVTGVTLHSLTFGAILRPDGFVGGFSGVPFKVTDAERQRYRDLLEVIRHIPKDASVAATDAETPHISNRVTAYALREGAGDADYLLISKRSLPFLRSKQNAEQALSRYKYGLVSKASDIYLFKRDHSSPETASAFAELGLKPGINQ